MAKLTLRDIGNKLKEKLQQGFGVNDGKPFVQSPVGQKINNFNQNFTNNINSKVWQPIASMPRFEFKPSSNPNTVVRTGINIAKSIPESFINIPRNLLAGKARQQIIQNNAVMQRKVPSLLQLGQAYAPSVEGLMDLSSFGLAKGLAKEGGRTVIKEGVKTAIAKQGIKGMGLGAIGGTTYGLDRQYGKDFNPKQLSADISTGAVLGGVLGGAVGGIGALKGLIKRPEEVTKQLRDKAGRWIAGESPIKPPKMPKAQWDFQLKFNKKYGRNPYSPVFAEDLVKAGKIETEKRIGLQARDINANKIPDAQAGLYDGPKTTKVWIKSKFSGGGGYADVPIIRRENNIKLYQGGSEEGRQFWTPNKKYAEQFGKVTEKTGDFYKIDNGNRVTDVYVEVKPNVAQQPLSVPSTKGVESIPVDPFEADMIKYNNELSSAAKLPKNKKPFIDTSRQSTDVGDIKSNIGEKGGVVDSIKRSFADWVNTRKASQVEGILQGRSFSDLRERGIQGIFEFQNGDKTGRYADVKNYFDTKYGQMQEKGIDFNYKEDYLNQIWDNTSEEIGRVFGRSLSKTPSFTLESLIKNYQEGINAGLKPKYNNIPDLIQSYESATNKAIADHDFFRTLIKENMITTGSKAPRDWVTVDPDRFPRFSVKTDDGTYRGIYKAPPELAKMLNNYLGGAKFEWLAKAADWTSSVKNRVLSFGIPGTAINAHGFNILARNVMASKNPIEGAITGIKYMLNPISAQRQLDATLAKAPEAVKYGLTLSANEFTNILQEPQGFRSKFGDVWNKLFERGLFDRMLPALKLQKFTEVFEGYKKGGMNEYEAGKAAAKFTNDVFGGINIDELGKSRDFENMLRVTILAPDWLKTNLNLAGKIPQSFTTKILDPKMSAYRKFATTMLGSYITANIVNKLTSGHWMYQNDPGNSFNIEAGYTEDGQKRYIRPFGTAADFVRLPSDVLTALKKGDVSVVGRLVRNRLSIPLGVGIGMMTDTDYAGQPIGWRGTDKYGNEMPLKQRIAGVGGEVLTLAGMPSFMKQGIDYASGKTGGEQALLQAFELPVRYSGGAFNKSSQFIKGLGQREGAKGEELYDLIKSVKGVTLSKNQKELLTQNGLKSLPDIMQQKKINSMNTQVQKIKEDIVSGSLTQEEGAIKIQDIVNQIPEVSTNKKGADNSLVSTASASDDLNKPYVFQYTSPSGKISIESVDLSKDIPKPKLTGNKELDKKLISTYKGELTSRATDIRKLYEAGKIDANQAERLLGELKIKYSSVGGAKKPKKITLKVSSYKAPKITIKKRSTKLPTIKFKKPKKIKIVRKYTIK